MRWLKFKRLTTLNISENWKSWNAPLLLVAMQNSSSLWKKAWQRLTHLAYDPTIFTPGLLTQEKWKLRYMNPHSNDIHSPNLETTVNAHPQENGYDVWSIHAKGYSLVKTKNGLLTNATTWMNFKHHYAEQKKLPKSTDCESLCVKFKGGRASLRWEKSGEWLSTCPWGILTRRATRGGNTPYLGPSSGYFQVIQLYTRHSGNLSLY